MKSFPVSAQTDGSGEGAVAMAEQDADGVVVPETVEVGRGQVELAVGIEVAGGQGPRVRAGGGSLRRLEAAAAVAQEHADRAVGGVRRRQVGFTVVVEV